MSVFVEQSAFEIQGLSAVLDSVILSEINFLKTKVRVSCESLCKSNSNRFFRVKNTLNMCISWIIDLWP